MQSIEQYREKYNNYHLPRYQQIPSIGLYSDQVITYVRTKLADIIDGPVITTAMINNYVKMGLIKPTNKKKYDQNHIAYLIVVCIFKQIYEINQISQLIQEQMNSFSTEVAYDYFCVELEHAIQQAFNFEQQQSPDSSITNHQSRIYVRSSVYCFAQKLLVETYLKAESNITNVE